MLCAVQENTVQRGRVFGNVENRLEPISSFFSVRQANT